MKKNKNIVRKRVEIRAAKGAEELISPEAYEETGLWIEEKGDEVLIRCCPDDAEAFLRLVRRCGIEVKEASVSEEPVVDYAELTKKYFRPVRIDGIVIRAPWNKATRSGTEIIVEPGMAFGTGRHESTRLMLKLMGDLDFKGKKVVDVGCGSAVLSIYASLCGAKSVLGVDNDADTIDSAQKNVELNGLSNVHLTCSDLINIKDKFDIVLANIDIRTFKATAGHVMDLAGEKGRLIVSGILGRDKKALLALFKPLELVRMDQKNAWRGFIFQKSRQRS